MPPKKNKKTKKALERMLLEPVPETPIPEPYFSIPSPEPYSFPLSTTLLQGIKLLENYFPEDINQKIKSKLTGRRIQRISRFKDVYCMMGKGGNGLLIGDQMLELRGITAFSYGPTYLVVAFDDLRLEVYTMQLKLIKALKSFSPHRITYLKLLTVPRNYESIILLSNCKNKVLVHRIQKSMFSTLSCKLSKDLLGTLNLEYPVTQMTQLPSIFRYYLRKDTTYKDTSLVCICAVNTVIIVRINHQKLDQEHFWSVVHTKKCEEITTNTASWGEANIQAPSRDIKGDKLVLSYSFGNNIFFLAFKEVEKYDENEAQIRCEWVESYAFELTNKRVAFCQYMKKNEILIITEDNSIIVFHTKNFDIFERPVKEEAVEMFSEQFSQILEVFIVL